MKSLFSKLLIAAALPLGMDIALAQEAELTNVQEIEIAKQTEVRFPGTMRVIGIKEGTVSLVVAIDREGQLQDTLILESSRRAFTKSALKSLSEWEFIPASYQGTPIDSSIRIDLNFQVDRKLTWQTLKAPGPADVTQTASKERPVTNSQFGELDEIPLPIEIVEPAESVEGKATIEFYIDELGHVRCPRATRSSSLEFGQTMLDTVSIWKFEPPVAEGAQTNTMVRQTFSYADGKLTAAEAN